MTSAVANTTTIHSSTSLFRERAAIIAGVVPRGKDKFESLDSCLGLVPGDDRDEGRRFVDILTARGGATMIWRPTRSRRQGSRRTHERPDRVARRTPWAPGPPRDDRDDGGSDDFVHWSKVVPMDPGAAPLEHLYTSQTHPYFRAPHIYIAFPRRFLPGQQVLRGPGALPRSRGAGELPRPEARHLRRRFHDQPRRHPLRPNLHGGFRPSGDGPAQLGFAGQHGRP